MANKINRICPHCGENLVMDSYRIKGIKLIVYCDNDDCPVQPCTDSALPSRVLAEVLAITGEKE